MSTDDIEADLTRNTENAPSELLARLFFFVCAVLSVVTTASIIVLLVSEAAKFFSVTAPLVGFAGETVSVVEFLTGTTWQVNSGEFGVLALSRAIGETMAVTVAAGSQAAFLQPWNPASYLEGALPMTAAMIQLLLSDITGGGLGYRSLFAVGLTLFALTLSMNIVSDLIAQRYREEY